MKLQVETNEKPTDAKNNVSNDWFNAAVLLFAYSLLNIMVPSAADFVYHRLYLEIQIEEALSFSAIFAKIAPIFIFVFLAFLYRKMFNESPLKWSQFQFKDTWIGLLTTAIIILSNMIISQIGEKFSYTANSENQEVIMQLSISFPVLTFLATVFVAPIVEEFFYRKLIMGHIFKDYAKAGLLVSSILFGLSHFTMSSLIEQFQPFHLLSYILMGFFFGLVYAKTKRIEASITAHFINNLISALILWIV